MGTLGDVPGLSDLLPSVTQLLPSDSSVLEVDANGEPMASVLGDVTQGVGSGDPFAVDFGFLDTPDAPDGGSGEGGEGSWPAANDPMTSTYMPSYSSDGVTVGGGPTGASFDDEQIANAKTISEVGKRVGATSRDIQTALMAAIVESGLKNLDYGDRDSVGLFQQRDAWGSTTDRTTPAKAAEMFFLGGQGGQRGLLDIKDRDKMSLGEAAQTVQVSAYPDRYAEHEAEAGSLMAAASGGAQTYGSFKGKNAYDLTDIDGKTVDNMTAAALQAAGKELGANFHIMQGSHNAGGVAASGGTHDGGGVVDIAPENGDWDGAVAALRKIGFAAWIRNAPGHGSAGSGEHIHAVLIGNDQLSSQALTQVNSYLHDDNGLAGSTPDDGPRDFVNNRFIWGETQKTPKEPKITWRDTVIRNAKTLLGTPFKWGGADYQGVDDIGLLRNVYGKVIPETIEDLVTAADPQDVASARPGDLISWGRDRLGLYVGNGQLIEAGGPGRVVQMNTLASLGQDAFSVPIRSILQSATGRPANRPAAVPETASPVAPVLPSGQGQMASPTRDTAAPVHHASPKPKPDGIFSGGTTFNQKPHGPA